MEGSDRTVSLVSYAIGTWSGTLINAIVDELGAGKNA
jgi:hypothetical protein